MTTRNANLLVDPVAAPVAGFQYKHAIAWPGGSFNSDLSGVADGATAELWVCTKYPVGGKMFADADVSQSTPLIPDTDFVKLTALTFQQSYNLDNLNPCIVIAKIITPGTNTRLRCIIG